MRNHLVVIENLSADASEAADIARLFRANRWILAQCADRSIDVRHCDGIEVPGAVRGCTSTIGFYEGLLSALGEDAVVFRVRSPNYPLHERLYTEIEEEFPRGRHDYVLSTGEECGLTGYFVERLSQPFLRKLARLPEQIMPSGYFNGAAIPGSGRHWFSLELRRFYYEDQFETLFDSPRSLSINLIGQCNYSCLKCQYHSSLIANKKTYGPAMPLERFQTVLDKVKDYRRLRSIFPTITGEPLMHPQIVELVQMIKDAGYSCGFTSNGSYLTSQLAERLLDAGIDSLAFSIDTTDPGKYDHWQHGGDLDEVERNLINFRDLTIKKRGSFTGSVNFVVGPDNEDEKETYRKKWHDRGFTVQFSTYYDIFDSNRPYFNDDDWGPGRRMPCWSLWHGLYLTDQGRAVSCGAMAKTLGIKDSIFEMSAPELWRCEALKTLRRQQLTGVKPGYCKEFTCWTGMVNTWVGLDDGLQLKALAYSSIPPPATQPVTQLTKPRAEERPNGWIASTRRMIRSAMSGRIGGA